MKRKAKNKEGSQAKNKAARTGRAATKKAVRTRWLKHREMLDERKQWQGSRCFDQWLLEQGESSLDGMQEEEEAEMPQVCCHCAVFANLSGLQKWQWYLCSIEMLAVAQAKDKPAMTARLVKFREKFAAASVGES